MIRALVAVVIVLTLLLGTLGWAYSRQTRQLAVTSEALERSESARKAAERGQVLLLQKNAAAAREAASARQALRAATAASGPAAEWGAQELPEEVINALDR